jgi:hypothetical protein
LVEHNTYCGPGAIALASGVGNIESGNHPDSDQLLSCPLSVGATDLAP